MVVLAWFAIVLGLSLAALWLKDRRAKSLIAALAWVLYGVYEYLMHARVLCSGECNIRVDLLALWPALIAMTFVVGFGHVRNAWKRRDRA